MMIHSVQPNGRKGIRNGIQGEEVSVILRGIGLSVEDEFQCPKSG
jgi:hypothetical protein